MNTLIQSSSSPVFLGLMLVASLALSACGNQEMEGATQGTPPSAPTESAPPATPAEPEMVEDVQVVDVTVGLTFEPNAIRLDAGVPARLVFTRTTEDTCVKELKVPAFDVGPVELPLGEPVAVEFTPTEAGEFTFVCGMDMVSGSLVVQS